jgi:glycosyltransferase AglI
MCVEASIIIPVLRDVAGLEVTLQSLAQDCRGSPVEIIVANDGADAAIRAVAARHGAQVIDIPASGGSYAARNAGLARAVADRLLFLDANVRVLPGWYRRMRDMLDAYDYVAGGVLLPQWSVRGLASALDFLREFPSERFFADGWSPTVNLGVRRRVFDRLGPFDGRLRSAGDREFGHRVWANGLPRAYCAEAAVMHPLRSWRAQIRKLHRVRKGVEALSRLYPDRYGDCQFRPLRHATMLLPPRFIPFHTRRLRDLPAVYALAWPLFYMMTWYFRAIVYCGNLRDFRPPPPDRVGPMQFAD